MAYRLLLIFSSAMLVCSTVSCTVYPPDSLSETNQPHHTVRAVEVKDNEPQLYVSLFNHPHHFEADKFNALMGALTYFPIDPRFRYTARPIFPESIIREAAPLIRETFREAKPYQKIQFEVHTPEGMTAGDTFMLDEKLHWRFDLIEGVPQYDTFYNMNQFKAQTSLPRNWELDLQDGQQYFSTELILGLEQDRTNWVVVKLPPETDGEAEIRRKGHTIVRPETERKNLFDRLHFLQTLKEDGLISNEDFHAKVQALVKIEESSMADPRERLRFLKELRDSNLISQTVYKKRVREVLEPL